MAAGDVNNMPARIKGLFDDVQDYRKNESGGKEIVLFMDEFHQVVQLSDASVEALKPMLADSGVRGIKVIAATTYREFEKYISPNQPLVERLYRLNLREADKDMVMRILKGAAKTYGVAESILNDTLYEQIYEYTNLYIPANAQPRKSLLMFDAMIGWHRTTGRKLDLKLLADVIYESEGVNVSFRVNAGEIKQNLDAHVFSQELATEMVARRLNVAVADLHDKTRPMSSFLFSGPTGVGKTELAKAMAELLFKDQRSLIRFDMTEYSDKPGGTAQQSNLRPLCHYM
jgi:ATP-dependent Clp protease ATP-binding subunit ClpC